MSISREYIFRETSIRKHCVNVTLNNALILDSKSINQLTIREIVLTDNEKEQYIRRCSESVNTYGKFLAKCFWTPNSPFDAKEIEIDTNNILEIEHL